MEVILLEKIERLGALGDVVRVRAGYARNYLIPMGKAKFATEENMAEVQERREELERKAMAALSGAEQRKARLDGFGSPSRLRPIGTANCSGRSAPGRSPAP